MTIHPMVMFHMKPNESYSYKDFVDWIYKSVGQLANSEELINAYVNYLFDSGITLARVNYGIRALHPQVSAITYLWKNLNSESDFQFRDDTVFFNQSQVEFERGKLVVSKFPTGRLLDSVYTKSPIPSVFRNKKPYRYSFLDEGKIDGKRDFEILDEIFSQGVTDYFLCPQFSYNSPFGYMSFSTKNPSGFSIEALDFLERSSHLVSIKLDQFAQKMTTESLLQVYLGKRTGKEVHAGKILRGDFEEISSVIWFSDIRNFTGISENLAPLELVEMLNEYFDICIGHIEDLGGEVLKMLGDGLLAVFPFEPNHRVKAHFKSLLAARRILLDLRKKNKERSAKNKIAIEHGVGLHFGKVLYGNIGSKERLDFTVIGDAVNISSRIAGLCGKLRKAVLASEEFANEVDIHWRDLGIHDLKGVSQPRKIFAIPQAEEMNEKNLSAT